MRGIECLRLRVKDIDFHRNEIAVRRGKGQKDRYVMLPSILYEPLVSQLQYVKRLHDEDLRNGYGMRIESFKGFSIALRVDVRFNNHFEGVLNHRRRDLFSVLSTE